MAGTNALAADSATGAARPAEDGSAAGSVRTVTLLHIEDDVSNQEIVAAVLASARPHWRVLIAENGRSGLERARAERPDVILLDLLLPDLRGDAVLAELRRDKATRGIPVVILSAQLTAPLGDMLLISGADDYIAKPFEVLDLLARLDRTLLRGTRVK